MQQQSHPTTLVQQTGDLCLSCHQRVWRNSAQPCSTRIKPVIWVDLLLGALFLKAPHIKPCMCQSAWQTFWQPVLHSHPRLVTNMVPLSFRSASRSLSDRSRARWSRSCLGGSMTARSIHLWLSGWRASACHWKNGFRQTLQVDASGNPWKGPVK